MHYKIEIFAENPALLVSIAELLDAERKLSAKPVDVAISSTSEQAENVDTSPDDQSGQGDAPKRRKRKSEAPQAAEPAPAAEYTKDQVVEALKKVSVKHGLSQARAVLTEFGAKTVGDVPKEKYQEFISRCEGLSNE